MASAAVAAAGTLEGVRGEAQGGRGENGER
jgi:hypothetical protein